MLFKVDRKELIMYNKKTTNRMVLSGMLVAVGLVLPFFTAHALGFAGSILLPMHIPVFLMGLLCGPFYGAIGGILIPVLSSLLTGMPPAFPMLPIMVGELFAYGLLSGLLYKKYKIPLYLSLIMAMVGGRIVYGLILAALVTTNNPAIQTMSVSGALIQGIPGILIQLVIIPVIVVATNKFYRQENSSDHVLIAQEELLQKAIHMIKNEKASFVIIKNNVIVHTAIGPGIKPLLALYEQQPELLRDACIVDKVIGKAAAMIAVLGGVASVHGLIMSKNAETYLTNQQINVHYDRCVDVISNRTGNGLCPLEKAVLEEEDPQVAYVLLKETIRKLMNAV